MQAMTSTFNSFFSDTDTYYKSAQHPSKVAKIGDAVRGSLLVEKLDQIPGLLRLLDRKVFALRGKLCIKKNFWKEADISSKGYVGIHISVWLPVPKNPEKMILTEVQIHPKAINDGTINCAKEVAHYFFKMFKKGSKDDKIIVSCSQLIYLAAMVKLLSNEEQLKRAEDFVDVAEFLQTSMGEEKRQKKAIIETIQLFFESKKKEHEIKHENKTKPDTSQYKLSDLGTLEFNKTYQAFVPKNKVAIAKHWRDTAVAVNTRVEDMLKGIKFDSTMTLSAMKNTANSLEELHDNARSVASIFRKMCEEAANLEGCSVTFGPDEACVLKTKESLVDKLKGDIREQLEMESKMRYHLATLKEPKWRRNGALCLLLAATIATLAERHLSISASKTLDAMQGVFNDVNNGFQGCMKELQPETRKDFKNQNNFTALSIFNTQDPRASIRNLTEALVTCNLKKQAEKTQNQVAVVQGKCQDEMTPIYNFFRVCNTSYHEGFEKLSSDDQAETGMQPINISVENAEKSALGFRQWVTYGGACSIKFSKCEKELTQTRETLYLAGNQTIIALNKTIEVLEKHNETVAPLYERKGQCSDLEEIKNENKRCNADKTQCLIDKGACENNKNNYKKEKETCETSRDDYKKKKETCETDRDDYKKKKETCETDRDDCKKKKETCETDRDDYKRKKETCEARFCNIL